MYSKTCLKRPLKKKTKNGFQYVLKNVIIWKQRMDQKTETRVCQDRLSLNAGQKYCADAQTDLRL